MRDGFGLKPYNGDSYNEKELPLSATYVIGQDGVITDTFLGGE